MVRLNCVGATSSYLSHGLVVLVSKWLGFHFLPWSLCTWPLQYVRHFQCLAWCHPRRDSVQMIPCYTRPWKIPWEVGCTGQDCIFWGVLERKSWMKCLVQHLAKAGVGILTCWFQSCLQTVLGCLYWLKLLDILSFLSVKCVKAKHRVWGNI